MEECMAQEATTACMEGMEDLGDTLVHLVMEGCIVVPIQPMGDMEGITTELEEI